LPPQKPIIRKSSKPQSKQPKKQWRRLRLKRLLRRIAYQRRQSEPPEEKGFAGLATPGETVKLLWQ
jgi:hypothetical protein